MSKASWLQIGVANCNQRGEGAAQSNVSPLAGVVVTPLMGGNFVLYRFLQNYTEGATIVFDRDPPYLPLNQGFLTNKLNRLKD